MTTPHFILCAISLRPHDPRARCSCDPIKLAAALEAERQRLRKVQATSGVVLHTRPVLG